MSPEKISNTEIAPHTKAKHIILEKYLGAWFSILGMYQPVLNYIDGFCGSGQYKSGDAGSPIIALNIAMGVIKNPKNKLNRINFGFVDCHKKSIEELKNKVSNLTLPTGFNVVFVNDNFEGFIDNNFFEGARGNKTLLPTFAFIDPFGPTGVTYESIRKILSNPKSEVLVNVMVESANRWINHPDSGLRKKIEALFGTSEVHKIPHMENCDRIEEFRKLYHSQIKKCANHVYDFEMRGKNNNRIYYLFFATNNEKGILKMKEACWTVDGISGSSFSDKKHLSEKNATNQQLSFFDDGFEIYHELSNLIIEKFKNQSVTVKDIENFVVLDTNYLPKHMKAVLKELENNKQIKVLDEKKMERRDAEKHFKRAFRLYSLIRFRTKQL